MSDEMLSILAGDSTPGLVKPVAYDMLEPVHPIAEDPHLALCFTVEVPDPTTAERMTTRLQYCKAIGAAYLKPPDEMP